MVRRAGRSQTARWAQDNFDRLVDPDPQISEALNDRAADNWRPLLAIADLAGGEWPQLARQACLTLSGKSPEETLGVMLVADCRPAFGDDDVIRSADLVAKLSADPERPWAEYNRGKAITQRQVAKLLGTCGVISVTVHPDGLPHAKGYRRARFRGSLGVLLPCQNPSRAPIPRLLNVRTCKCPWISAQVSDFQSVRKDNLHGSKNGNLSHSHAGVARSHAQRSTGW